MSKTSCEMKSKFHTRGIKVTPQMTKDAITVLKLMGLPVFEAKGEAEAQCVELLKQGLVSAVASDDMDCLTFGSKTLLKGIKTKKDPVVEINLDDVLQQLNFTEDQFIDFCILSGCDYCDTIGQMGPVKAFNFITEHKTIEKVLEVLNEKNEQAEENNQKMKYLIPTPENFDYQTARELFKKPDVYYEIPKVF